MGETNKNFNQQKIIDQNSPVEDGLGNHIQEYIFIEDNQQNTFDNFSLINVNNYQFPFEAQLELYNLLKSWNLDVLFKTCIDNFIDIDAFKGMKHTFKVLFYEKIPIGLQIKLDVHLTKWQKEILEYDFQDTKDPSYTQKATLNTQHPSETSYSSGPYIEKSLEKSKVNSLDLPNLLSKSHTGLEILNYYKIHNVLSDTLRNLLVNKLSQYLLEQDIKMSVGIAENLAFKVKSLFPMENSGVYFFKLPGQKPMGKIYSNYFNQIRSLQNAGILKKRSLVNTEENIPKLSQPILTVESNIQTNLDQIFQDNCSWAEIEQHYAATSNYRMQEIAKCNSTGEILKKWIQYKKPFGYKLIEIDFNTIHPNTESIEPKFTSFALKINDIFERKIKDKNAKCRLTELKSNKNISESIAWKKLCFLSWNAVLRPLPVEWNSEDDIPNATAGETPPRCTDSTFPADCTSSPIDSHLQQLLQTSSPLKRLSNRDLSEWIGETDDIYDFADLKRKYLEMHKKRLHSMSGPSEPTGSDRPCGLASFIPIGMSCRGRAEAFARRLQSRLRTLGTQGSTPLGVDSLEQPETSWLTQNEQPVTNSQPLRNNLISEADSFFDFDIDNESPGSPAEECEYSRLIETQSNTPHDAAPESGYVCASPISPEGSLESQSSSDGPYFDPESSDAEQRSITGDYFDCIEGKKDSSSSTLSQSTLANGHLQTILDSDSCSESLPPSQSTDTCTAPSSASNSTLQDVQTELDSTATISSTSTTISTASTVIAHPTTLAVHGDGEKYKIDMESQQCNGDATKLIPNGHVHAIPTTAAAVAMDTACNDVSSLDLQKQLTLESIKIIKAEMDETEPDEILTITENNEIEIAPQTKEEVVDEMIAAVAAAAEDETTQLADDKSLTVPNGTDDGISADEDDVEDPRPQRIRRCSSLKTGKTPPGTPGRKKIVRFADVLGLDLADVRTFLDEIPKIPRSAFDDLEVVDGEQAPQIQLGPRADKMLMPLFQQPAGLPNFLDMVRDKQVCLENACVSDPICLTITGCVRVRNLDFHKSVHIRYSLDQWNSFADLQANYVENSCDGFSDKFSFILFGNALKVGQRLEMSVRFHCRGQQFWDNNYGQNYVFQCLPTAAPVIMARNPLTDDSWCRSFY